MLHRFAQVDTVHTVLNLQSLIGEPHGEQTELQTRSARTRVVRCLEVPREEQLEAVSRCYKGMLI